MLNSFRITALVLAALMSPPLGQTMAGDWPQIMGPQRNGITDEEPFSGQWPGGKPRRVWEVTVGSGFAGVAVSGQTAVLFHREGASDKLSAFATQSGTLLWSTSFPSTFRAEIVDDDGPRAVPTIQDGAVYAYSAQGGLYCVDLKGGQKRWERQTHQDFRAAGGYFGAGSAPLVERDLVIVNVGGDRMGAGVVAFHTASGETAWKAVNDQASYSAPIAATIDGVRHLLCITRMNFVSLDPETGEERFRTPFGQRGPTVTGALPVISGKHALLTASYGIGAEWLEIGAKKIDIDWSDEILSSQYTTPILHDGACYGINGRQDGGAVSLKCFDPHTRQEFWSRAGLKYATLICADGKLLIMQTDGVLKIARLAKSGYEELASTVLLPGTTRALPALAHGQFYVRNEKTLLCVDLKK